MCPIANDRRRSQTWDYEQGTVLTDPTGVAFGDYYGRLVAHYVEGGFVDEAGVFRPSPYHFNISCVRTAARRALRR